MTRLAGLITSRKGVVVVLAATWFAILASNTLFLLDDGGRPRGVDCAVHLDLTYQMAAGARLHGVGAVLEDLAAFPAKWPALVHVLYGLLGATVDHGLRALRLYDMLFMAVLLVGMFWLGQLCHSRAAGLLAAVCCALAPNLIGASRQYGLDFPCAAMVTISMAALLATRRFSTWRASAAFGLLGGVAMLTKGQSLLFLAPPALGVLGLALWRGERRALWGFGLAVALGLAVSAAWWAPRLEQLLEIFLSHFHASELAREGDQTVWGGLRMYVLGLPWLVSPPLTAGLLLFGLPALSRRWRLHLPLALWLLVPLALHVVLEVRNYRYLLPLVPAVALVAAVGVMSVKATSTRRVATAALAGASLLTWLLCGATALRQPVWACNTLICGVSELNQITRAGPLTSAAQAVAGVLARERHAGRQVFLLAAHDPEALARTGDLVDIANSVRSLQPEVAWVFQDAEQTPWRTSPRGPHARYLLGHGTALPRGVAGLKATRVLQIDTRVPEPSSSRICTEPVTISSATSVVSLWKLHGDTNHVRLPERR